jgi:hypothetical protein
MCRGCCRGGASDAFSAGVERRLPRDGARQAQVRRSIVLLVIAASIVFAARVLAAQTIDSQPPIPARVLALDQPLVLMPVSMILTAGDRGELDAWVRSYIEWHTWAEEWRGRTEPGWFHRRDRRQKPDPPEWLDAVCADGRDDREWLVEACALRDDWAGDFLVSEWRQKVAASRTQQEAPTKTMWWEHVHVDGFWPVLKSHGTAFGAFGTHATIDVTGRFQVFVAPGFMMLNVPTSTGREWTPATDWGFAYRLGTFKFPGYDGKATLHVDFAKAWLFLGAGSLFDSSVDLAGFSMTFSRNRATGR